MWVTTNLISSQFAPGCRTATVSNERAAHHLSNLDRQRLRLVAQRYDNRDQIHQQHGEVVPGDQDHVAIHADVVDGDTRNRTSTPENETTEAWSRDGTRTLVDFARLIDHSIAKSDVAVVNMATGAVTNLTNTTNSNDDHADWQP